ncbi:hypothetical protein DL770_006931 [Monosporascus sp. CRB-9-2]|nr:hypothetical protein DL770_006931 [Monosporascus sp. CRB-9-2]
MYAYFKYLAGLLMVFLLVQTALFDTIGASHAISAVPAAGFAATTSLGVDVVHVTEVSIHLTTLQWMVRSNVAITSSPATATTASVRNEAYTITCGSDEETYVMTVAITNGIGQAMPRVAKKGKPNHKGPGEEEESLECQASSESSEDLPTRAIALITLGCVIGIAILTIVAVLVIKCSRRRMPTVKESKG